MRYWKYYVLPAIAALLYLLWGLLRPKDDAEGIGPPPEPVAPEMYDQGSEQPRQALDTAGGSAQQPSAPQKDTP